MIKIDQALRQAFIERLRQGPATKNELYAIAVEIVPLNMAIRERRAHALRSWKSKGGNEEDFVLPKMHVAEERYYGAKQRASKVISNGKNFRHRSSIWLLEENGVLTLVGEGLPSDNF